VGCDEGGGLHILSLVPVGAIGPYGSAASPLCWKLDWAKPKLKLWRRSI